MVGSRNARRCLSGVALISVLTALGGCAPALRLDDAAPLPESFSEGAAASQTLKPMQTGAQSQAVTGQVLSPVELAHWWERFHDPMLTSLISGALERNYDLRIAVERVEEARAGALGARSRLLPNLGVGANAMRYDGGDTDLVLLQPFGVDRLEFDRWQAGLQASWEVDLFGQGRARLAAARAISKAAEADVQAVRLSLAAGVADLYVSLRGLQMQQQYLRESLAIADEVLRIAESSFTAGVVQSTDVDLARAEFAQLRAREQELDTALTQVRLNLENITVLAPGSLVQPLAQQIAMPDAPAEISPGQPADLLLRRPDLIAAQARFEAALSQGDAARLNYLPRLSLGAVLGRSGIYMAGESLGASGFWMADLLLSMPLLDFGARQSEVQLSDARSRQAFLALEQRARVALFDVERALGSLTRSDMQQQARREEVAERAEVLRKTLLQYQLGDVGRLEMAQARAASLNSQSSLVRDQVGQLQAHIALFRAMGGGWQDGAPEAQSVSSSPVH